MVKCEICGYWKPCYRCITTQEKIVISCIECAIAGVRLGIVKKVYTEKEVGDETTKD